GGCGQPVDRSERAVVLPPLATDPQSTALIVGAEGQWPGWRGPNRQGVWTGARLPDTWSTNEGVAWRVKLPGRGNSSPVVWNDRIFVTTAIQDESGTHLQLLCLDARQGTIQWQAGGGVAAGDTHPKNGFASSSVVCDGGRVIACWSNGTLACYDYAGQPQWRTSLGQFDHQWGAASSPILFGDLVIQLCDHLG
ncbi:MAG: PQQ-binding-like beta-propeller repeat protein, partial [bacterium]|nr:PQQ-binding-like beta-propeller repeat protein [bacterium]